MESGSQRTNRFTATVDLTTRAQRELRHEEAVKEMSEPGQSLPGINFDQMPPALQAAARAAGWTSLMPVQQTAIPYLLERRDLIVQSKTGSGKTGAFLLPLFEMIDPDRREPQVLILTPTRELSRQIHDELERMQATPEVPVIRTALIYGGVRYAPQFKALEEGAQVVIGTPGRILDHLERKSLNLRSLSVLVLDEADEMLSMGFYPAMQQLRRYLPRERTSYMFSATIPHKVRRLADEFLLDPGFLSLSGSQISVEALTHRYYVVEPMDKDRILARLIEMENPDSAIIFANTKRDVEYLATFLRNYGYDADEISGDLSQKSREQVMDRIRRGALRFLVATDVAARGIDISDLSHVFMHDVPQDPEYYVHRSGRTARAGKTGTAIVLCTLPEERTLKSIARRYGIELERRPVPEDVDVERRVAERTTVLLEARYRSLSNLERERLRRFVPLAKDLAAEEPEILAAMLDELYQAQLHARPVNPDEPAPEAPERIERREGERKGGGKRRKGGSS
ncbi:MAG TPA: DEAD/DEAH box helicase [Rhodothermales bacterium]